MSSDLSVSGREGERRREGEREGKSPSSDSTSDAYRQYMQVVDCYELAPPASTVIAIDREMKVRYHDEQLPIQLYFQVGKAFAAVYENKVGAGLVWDSTMNKVSPSLPPLFI